MYVLSNENVRDPIFEIEYVDFVEKLKTDPEFRKRVYASKKEMQPLLSKRRRNTAPSRTNKGKAPRNRHLSVTEHTNPIIIAQLPLPVYGQSVPSSTLPLNASNEINLFIAQAPPIEPISVISSAALRDITLNNQNI
nr:hypothetical protein HmN_000687800 [Hymenolepis microstoma]